MTITKLFSYLVVIAMTFIIFWAQNQISITDSLIPELPWGIVSLIDLYSGFIFISIWIFFKEKFSTAFGWTIFMMILGNLTTAIYVLYSFKKAEGSMEKFFLGKNI